MPVSLTDWHYGIAGLFLLYTTTCRERKRLQRENDSGRAVVADRVDDRLHARQFDQHQSGSAGSWAGRAAQSGVAVADRAPIGTQAVSHLGVRGNRQLSLEKKHVENPSVGGNAGLRFPAG